MSDLEQSLKEERLQLSLKHIFTLEDSDFKAMKKGKRLLEKLRDAVTPNEKPVRENAFYAYPKSHGRPEDKKPMRQLFKILGEKNGYLNSADYITNEDYYHRLLVLWKNNREEALKRIRLFDKGEVSGFVYFVNFRAGHNLHFIPELIANGMMPEILKRAMVLGEHQKPGAPQSRPA